MTETTEKMAPCDACRWYYDNQAAGQKMERRYPEHAHWDNDDGDGNFRASFIYRLKQRVLRSGALFEDVRSDSSYIDSGIEDPGPEAVILPRYPTAAEIHNAIDGDYGMAGGAVIKLLQSMALEVER